MEQVKRPAGKRDLPVSALGRGLPPKLESATPAQPRERDECRWMAGFMFGSGN